MCLGASRFDCTWTLRLSSLCNACTGAYCVDNFRGLPNHVRVIFKQHVWPLQMMVCCHCLLCCRFFTSKKILLAVTWKSLRWLILAIVIA